MTTWTPPDDKHWFKSVGSGDWPMAEDWFDVHPNETEIIHFARQPTGVRTDDPLLYYAANHQRIFGVVNVFTPPELDRDRDRWAWFARVRPMVIIRSFGRAPSLDALSQVDDTKDWHQFVQQMDYRSITEEVFNYAAAALVAIADPATGDILDSTFAARFRP